MSHPIDPRYIAEGKRAADQMMEAAFGRTGVSPETTEDRLLKCMRRTENAEAEVKRLRAERAALEQDRDLWRDRRDGKAWADLLAERERYRHGLALVEPVLEAVKAWRELLRYPPGGKSRPLAPILRAEAAIIDAFDASTEPRATEAGDGR